MAENTNPPKITAPKVVGPKVAGPRIEGKAVERKSATAAKPARQAIKFGCRRTQSIPSPLAGDPASR